MEDEMGNRARRAAKPPHNGGSETKDPKKSQQQFIDILRDAKQFHEKLSDVYENMSGEATKEKARLLLQHLSAREEYLAECLDEYENQSTDQVLQSWFKYTPDLEDDIASVKADFHPDMSAEDVAELVWKSDEQLLTVIREIQERAVPETLQESIGNLVRLLERDKAQKMNSTITD